MSLRARLALVLAGVLAGPVVAAGLVVAVLVPRARAGDDSAALSRALASTSAYLTQRCTGLGEVARATALDLSGALSAGRPLDGAAAQAAVQNAAQIAGQTRDAPVVSVVVAGRSLASTAPGVGADQAQLESLLLASCSRGVAPPAAAPAQVESVPVIDASGREAARVIAVAGLDDGAVAALRQRLALGADLTVLSDGRPVAGDPPIDAATGGADLSGALAAAGGDAASGATSGVADGVRYRSAPPASGIPYGLLVWTPSGAGGLRLALAVVAVAAFAVCAVLLTVVTGRLTRPLLGLARTAARIRRGDLTARTGVTGATGDDEVTALAAAFDAMAGRIEGGEEELQASREALSETHARFVEALTRTHDLEGLLQVVLDAARDATDATAGSALLGEARSLEERASSTRPGAETTAPRILDGLAPLARGAVERNDTARQARPVPALVVPLRSGSRLVGALALARESGAAPFDDIEVEAAETLARHAGVAVANVLDHEETRRLSVTDALTGAGNFRHLSTTLAREVERATRFSRPLSVVMLDLDHFKRVNDTHGHAFGDGVLREVARRLQDCLREVDTVARYGGEEFTVVLPETGSEGAAAVAARIVQAVRSRPFTVGPLRADVTVSAGVAAFPDHGRTASEILRAADAALYVAKSAGRDRWCLAEVVLPGQEPDAPLEGPVEQALEDVPSARPGRGG